MNEDSAARILGIGTALPTQSISQVDSCEHAAQFFSADDKRSRTLSMLYKRTDIESRSLVVLDAQTRSIDSSFFPSPHHLSDRGPSTAQRMDRYEAEVLPLALAACRKAISQARIDAEELTHIVTASCTGFAAPGFDLGLVEGLPLSPSAMRTHIGFMGCHGALNALRVANAFCRADQTARVLVCAAELCSVHMQYEWNAQRLVANSIFADGAAAVVVSARQSNALVSPKFAALSYLSSRSHVLANSADAMRWQIGDNGFVMTLAAEVPHLIESNLPGFMRDWLASLNLSIGDIGSWAVHPGGPRILDAVQSSLGLSDEDLAASRQVLAQCGNMSSPTVLFILDKLLSQGRPRPCVILGFGPGLTIEAALVG